MNASELAVELRKADYDTPYVWDLTAKAADLLEAQDKAMEEMRSRVLDLQRIIERKHDSGEMPDGGDLRYWCALTEHILASHSKEGEQG